MQKSIYQSYIDSISDSLKNGKKRGEFKKAQLSKGLSGFDEAPQLPVWINEARDEQMFDSLKPLSDITGRKVKYHQKPGAHPDFVHVKEKNTVDYHYCMYSGQSAPFNFII
jgi:hypothetical protein